MGLQRSSTNLWEALLYSKLNHSNGGACVPRSSDGHFVNMVKRLKGTRGQPCWEHFRVHELSFQPQYTNNAYISNITGVSTLDSMTGMKGRNITFFVTVKSPLAWLASDCKYHNDKKDNKTKECSFTGRNEENQTLDEHLQWKVQEWRGYVAKWIELRRSAPDRVVIVPYEALLSNKENLVNYLDYYLGNVGLRKMQNLVEAIQVRQSSKHLWQAMQEKY